MSKRQRNVLFLMSDEHLREAAGCYGSALVRTPNLDKLAARGTRFTNAYTPSPICVPARASLATGRYVHEHRCWSNAQPYDGSMPGWGRRLIAEGHRSVSVGKLHYRSADDDNGFDEEVLPLHVRGGRGWLRGLLRRNLTRWDKAGDFAGEVGPGECDYTHYDRRVAESACDWLQREGTSDPWTLFVSFVTPHYPLIVPHEYYDLYPLDQMELPRQASAAERPTHPVVKALREFMDYDAHFDDHLRRVARACYYGMCTFLDDNIGQVLKTLEDLGQLDDTTIVYTSDHGELLGNRGMWTKCVMYEESAAIPMLLSGPGIPAGVTNDTPVSLVDCYQTIIESSGLQLSAEENALPGHSLVRIANGDVPRRTILSEYHDGGSITGMFMIRHGQWKYVNYPGYPPELYDLINDPHEAHDLTSSDPQREVLGECEHALRKVVDPDAANDLAFADQAQLIEELGGQEAILSTPDYDHSPAPVAS